ncbi:hypothetical protein E4U41_007105 [Claviceps citrina]|nr:hypothetical protein E4U41_007105 [Claviceps citrina]
MRSVHAAVDSSCSRQQHDAFDTTSQATPVAPLQCFITTEAALHHQQGIQEQNGSAWRPQSRKQHGCSLAPESGCDGEVRQPRPTAPMVSQSTKDESSPSPNPFHPDTSGPDSGDSIPSSPGDLSSSTMSEDPQSLSASLSELPRRQSPGPSSYHPVASATAPVPQLVMPSLTVPRRRHFTETGRSLGKLRILVTGQAGLGKASLILAIAQTSSHIVHMDSMDSAVKSTMRITYASTRPKPWWRTDQGQNLAKRRRSSLPDEVLDRNICFVDGDAHTNGNGTSFPAVQYVETQLAHLFRSPIDDLSLVTLLSSGTEPNVDVALYLLPSTGLSSSSTSTGAALNANDVQGPSLLDIECLRNLALKTNVIPLLALADLIPTDRLAPTKNKIRRDLKLANIDCFTFSHPTSGSEYPSVYAVSSVTRLDYDTIDASILMASDYQPPLLDTDLDSLVTDAVVLNGHPPPGADDGSISGSTVLGRNSSVRLG